MLWEAYPYLLTAISIFLLVIAAVGSLLFMLTITASCKRMFIIDLSKEKTLSQNAALRKEELTLVPSR
jgi:hypothetical protein